MTKENKCFLCGKAANSREHRYKKSDLIRSYGKERYKNERIIIAREGERDIYLNGPNADVVKYDKYLCNECNNSRSQKMDIAYDEFVNYVFTNENDVKKYGISLDKIWGDGKKIKIINLLQYYAKHICCRLLSADLTITDSAIQFLTDKTQSCPFIISFWDSIEYYKYSKLINEEINNLCLGRMLHMRNKVYGEYYAGDYGVRWFVMSWKYYLNHSINMDMENIKIIKIEKRSFTHFGALF